MTNTDHLPDITDSDIQYIRRKVLEWGRANFKEFPWRHLSNQWHSLVVEIMLQRTKADQVEPVFLEFVERYPAPEDYLADTDSNVFEHLGLPQRREWLKALAHEISQRMIFRPIVMTC